MQETECVILNGEQVDIDKRFVNLILLLNTKGYITHDCCSGHYYKNVQNIKRYAYIGFYEKYLPPNFPKFVDSIDKYGDEFVGVYFNLPNNPSIEYLDCLANNILQWVIELPYNNLYLENK